jgi:hypothetical protein
MKQLKPPSPAVADLWKKNYMKDAAKFISPTYLDAEDYHGTFKDHKGVEWRILGAITSKEIPCQIVETEEVFIWQAWDVSQLVHPDKHENYRKEQTFENPKKK